jgi:hypothetical protein
MFFWRTKPEFLYLGDFRERSSPIDEDKRYSKQKQENWS